MTTCTQPATGSATSHFYVEELNCGITPSNPVWLPLRYTSGNMQQTKDSLQSAELDGSREIADLRLGSNQTAGEISVELAWQSHDDLIEAALGGTWTIKATLVGLSVTVSPSLRKFTRAAGSYVADGVVVGDLVKFEDLTGDNSLPFIVESVSALEVVVFLPVDVTLTIETATTDVLRGDEVGVGTEKRSFSILTNYADADGGVGIYQLTKGVEITAYSFDCSVNALVTGTFSTIGRETAYDVALPSGSTFPAVLKNEVFSGIDGKILADNTVLGYVTASTFAVDNNASAQFELGSDNVSFIERGRANNTLSLSTFFVDSGLLNKFIDETETAIEIALNTNDRENIFAFMYQRAVFTSGTPEVSGEGSIVQTLAAQALKGSTGGSSVLVKRL